MSGLYNTTAAAWLSGASVSSSAARRSVEALIRIRVRVTVRVRVRVRVRIMGRVRGTVTSFAVLLGSPDGKG